jgi:transcription termination factor Rho
MTTQPKIERSMLDGKDREELHAIASAIGLKAVTRLKKADLVEAILDASGIPTSNGSSSSSSTASSGSNGAGHGASSDGDGDDKPKRVRSRKDADVDPIAALAAEEDAIASVDTGRSHSNGSAAGGDGAPSVAAATDAAPSQAAADETSSTEGAAAAGSSNADATATGRTESSGRSRDGSNRGGSSRDNSNRDNSNRDNNNSNRDGGNRGGGDRNNASGGFDDAEPGNRRRRRRRGRERTDRPERAYEGGEPRNEPRNEPRGGGGENLADPIDVQGLLDLRDEGYGFLRTASYLAGRNDVYVSASQVRRFALRKGDFIQGASRPQASNEKYPALLRVDMVNGMEVEAARGRVRFEDLTPLFPDSRLGLEILDEPASLTGRIVDLISPIGKGQRGLVVSPPKAGKTTILKQIVASIERNNPEVHLMVLLVDERPEEVTDMRRHVLRGEVVASTFDRPSDEHTHVAELTIERAKRLVELGKDVVIVLDGITRLARAYNLAAPTSGRIMSGGVDSTALYPPKRFFGAARNIEEGGSLTIIATALVETGSKMDEVIFEEFKGTGNMELRLDRRLAEKRIYPAIDVEASSTRHEELLFDRNELQQVWKLRRVLNALEGAAGLELLNDKLRTTRSNAEFLAEIAKAPTPGG